MIVSNTSPLRYLIAVRQAQLIQQIFDEVIIPPAVLAELMHPAGREDVRDWIANPPAWLRVRGLQSSPTHELMLGLDAGESEALQLAIETNPDFVLMDERLGRKAAFSLGLTVIGALGILREGFRKGNIVEPLLILDEMRAIGFRISESLLLEFRRDIQSLSAI